MQTGTESTALIVLRGNSASGKSTTAAKIRARHGLRDLAIVSQDNLRREVLRERDVPGGASVGLIDLVARYSLDHGFHVIVEGILYADRYGEMLAALCSDHRGLTCCYYFDVPFEETLRRHVTKRQAVAYGETEMRDWYRERDLLPGGVEHIIPADSSPEDTVRRVIRDSGLGQGASRQCEAT